MSPGPAHARRRSVKRTLTGYLFLSPALVFYLVFLVVPIAMSLYISFRDWNMLVPMTGSRFVGLKNYTYLLTRDELFVIAVRNTIIYATGTVFVGMALALGIAILLLRARGATFWRFVMFAPVVTPSVAVARIWGGLYRPAEGLANAILRMVHLPPQQWLADPNICLYSIMLIAVWAGIGATVIVFTAGLKGIPEVYYDAARLDGAGPWGEFRHITVPMLRPTILFISVTGLIGAWQAFDLIFMLAVGGTEAGTSPVRSVIVLALYLYQMAFKNLRMGRACAGAFLLFLIVLGISFLVLRVLRKGGVESYE
ncbi:MAG: carbohydrate ABC transporter permease [Bacillota bacterium]